MKTFELSERVSPKGERSFKVVLHEIFPDDCVVNETGTQYNRNGITWIRSHCERALPSLIDKSITAQFLDPEKTELHGHGDTGMIDGVPVFENAEIVGHFKKAYIETFEKDDGTMGTFAIGEGVIDEFRYKNLCDKIDYEISCGHLPKGSIEIFKKEENDAIIYQYGYKDKGRIPCEFVYSGYALLGVLPADDQAVMLELNNREESKIMDETKVKEMIDSAVEEINNSIYANVVSKDDEISACKKNAEECSQKIAALEEANQALSSELEECKKKLEAAEAKCAKQAEELAACKKKEECALEEVNSLKAEQKVAELESAIKDFSEEERAFAESEINAFKENPLEGNIELVTSKIFAGIGKLAKENEAKVANEINSTVNEAINIFGGMDTHEDNGDVNIF